ncbi:MAG TPA: hypothetical protein VIH54_05985 [Chthoniobacterales bacterium]|jgi:hypothetical protein
MKNELRNTVMSFDRAIWMYGPYGNAPTSVRRFDDQGRKRLPELSRTRLVNRAENDLASSIAYFVLAGSLFASLLEFFAALPGLP